MPTFHHSAKVNASLESVEAFHRDPRNLRRVTPLPMRLHRHEWTEDTGRMELTVWFGPLPVRWEAGLETHSDGFIDRQAEGPLEIWDHTHTFASVGPGVTRIDDDIEYTYRAGWRGWVSRLAFAPPALRVLFAYRIWRTRRALER